MHNEELHKFYCSKILLDLKMKENGMSRTCSKHEEEDKCIESFGGKTRTK